MSSIKALDDEKKEFVKTYTARELFDLVFTDYKNAPSELAKIPNLENLAKQRVSQIVDIKGINAKVIVDFFSIVQEVAVFVAEDIVAVDEATVGTAVQSAVYSDAGGGGGG
jgi:hypothetical protein